jgi:hypothetical protein
MPGKKPPSKKPPAAVEPDWQSILLEEIRSQGRATIEAIHGMRDELKRDIRAFAEEQRRARADFLSNPP